MVRHKLNNLLLQFSNGSFNESAVYTSPKHKRCRRSFQAASNSREECCYYSKRVGPSALKLTTNKEKDFMIDDCNKSNFIWSLMRKNSIPQSIPSWTGFQMVVNNNIPILKTTVVCLDCINAVATEISTVYQVLCRASNIVDSLNLLSILCVFDQTIYSEAIEIKWKEKEKLKNCLIMMGIFHLIMVYIHILSKRFKDAGLRDVLIQNKCCI